MSIGCIVNEVHFVLKMIVFKKISFFIFWGEWNVGDDRNFGFGNIKNFDNFISNSFVWNNNMRRKFENFFKLSFVFFASKNIRVYFRIIVIFSKIKNMTYCRNSWIIRWKFREIYTSKNGLTFIKNKLSSYREKAIFFGKKYFLIFRIILIFVGKKNKCILWIILLPKLSPSFGIANQRYVTRFGRADVYNEIHKKKLSNRIRISILRNFFNNPIF